MTIVIRSNTAKGGGGGFVKNGLPVAWPDSHFSGQVTAGSPVGVRPKHLSDRGLVDSFIGSDERLCPKLGASALIAAFDEKIRRLTQ